MLFLLRLRLRSRYTSQNHAAIAFATRKKEMHNSICTIMTEARGLGIAKRAQPVHFFRRARKSGVARPAIRRFRMTAICQLS